MFYYFLKVNVSVFMTVKKNCGHIFLIWKIVNRAILKLNWFRHSVLFQIMNFWYKKPIKTKQLIFKIWFKINLNWKEMFVSISMKIRNIIFLKNLRIKITSLFLVNNVFLIEKNMKFKILLLFINKMKIASNSWLINKVVK